MPSSICCPASCAAHFCADGIFACWNTSASSCLRKRPRWLTKPPRFVVWVTSGAVVTIRSASGSPDRSEEHTSELQSLMRISYAVFCLKNKKIKYIHNTDNYTNDQEQTDIKQ